MQTPEFITLKDGRKLAYRTFGAPDGTPMLFLHGTPGTSHQIAMADEGAKNHGFRLIAPDRPGLGNSSFQPNRDLYHYTLDIVQLMDHLGLQSCPITAISGGTPYAMQCAHDLPERITMLACLSGWVNYGRPEIRKIPLEKNLQVLDKICRHGPVLLPVIGRIANWLVKNKIDNLYKHLLEILPPADIAVLQNTSYRDILLEDLKHAYHQGWEGVKRETELQFSNPSLPVSGIHQPVYIMHGTADTIVPYGFAEYLAKELPNLIAFETVAEGGHLCAINEQNSIFAILRAQLDER